jgi:hypothetical protein
MFAGNGLPTKQQPDLNVPTKQGGLKDDESSKDRDFCTPDPKVLESVFDTSTPATQQASPAAQEDTSLQHDCPQLKARNLSMTFDDPSKQQP